jgi:predicted HicB family RNase H-like nuclease
MAPCAIVRVVPNQPATPNRTVRIPDEVWESAQRVAADRGETMTAVIIRALVRYVREYDG